MPVFVGVAMTLRLAVCLLGSLLVAGCDDGVGKDGKVVGGPCVLSDDCERGSKCLGGDDLRFPGGTCSKACGEEEPCPGESACVRLDPELPAGVCLLPCNDVASCREGYECHYLSNQTGDGSTTPVCFVEVQSM